MIGMEFRIDIVHCDGCHACRIACKDRSDLADGVDWLRVDAEEGGAFPAPTLRYVVSHCFHCAAAPCVAACPQGALVVRDGAIRVEAVRCTGCGECRASCPFDAIALDASRVASLCDACAPDVAQGWEPACVRSCPMRALAWAAVGGALPDGRRTMVLARGAEALPRVRFMERIGPSGS